MYFNKYYVFVPQDAEQQVEDSEQVQSISSLLAAVKEAQELGGLSVE
ncbi:hypothetical protein [Vibrio sp. 10N.286.49.B3]|nr:hypothetical protein [Vibrio sp. 10N.286.49.B3]